MMTLKRSKKYFIMKSLDTQHIIQHHTSPMMRIGIPPHTTTRPIIMTIITTNKQHVEKLISPSNLSNSRRRRLTISMIPLPPLPPPSCSYL